MTNPTTQRTQTGANEALVAAALRIERELICCDVFDRIVRGEEVPSLDYHAICHWGGAARALVLEGIVWQALAPVAEPKVSAAQVPVVDEPGVKT